MQVDYDGSDLYGGAIRKWVGVTWQPRDNLSTTIGICPHRSRWLVAAPGRSEFHGLRGRSLATRHCPRLLPDVKAAGASGIAVGRHSRLRRSFLCAAVRSGPIDRGAEARRTRVMTFSISTLNFPGTLPLADCAAIRPVYCLHERRLAPCRPQRLQRSFPGLVAGPARRPACYKTSLSDSAPNRSSQSRAVHCHRDRSSCCPQSSGRHRSTLHRPSRYRTCCRQALLYLPLRPS